MEIQNKETYWFALYTKPRAEKKTNERLIEKGFKTYFPVQTVLRQWSDRKKRVTVPLFSSYIFINTSLMNYEQIRKVEGVVNFVYYLGKPAIIRNEEIEAIEHFLTHVSDIPVQFEQNDKVMVVEGSLKNIYGKVIRISKNKIRLSIEQLGISLIAELPRRMLKKVD